MKAKLLKLIIILFFLTINPAIAGQITGQVNDKDGNGLYRVRVCLQEQPAYDFQCEKIKFTDNSGKYSFKGVSKGNFLIKVNHDSNLRGRKENLYPSYSWTPSDQLVSLPSKQTRAEGINFTGTFNFSNFQSEFQLDSSYFPELSFYDFYSDYVFLKVYTNDTVNNDQNVIFLGQLNDPNTLNIEVSVPNSERTLYYELYSFNFPDIQSGMITLD